jgi:hypothetical protein
LAITEQARCYAIYGNKIRVEKSQVVAEKAITRASMHFF